MLASNMCKIIAQSSGGDGRKCQRQNGHFIEVEEIQNTITTETLESVARLLPVYVVVGLSVFRSLNCCFSQKKKFHAVCRLIIFKYKCALVLEPT